MYLLINGQFNSLLLIWKPKTLLNQIHIGSVELKALIHKLMTFKEFSVRKPRQQL